MGALGGVTPSPTRHFELPAECTRSCDLPCFRVAFTGLFGHLGRPVTSVTSVASSIAGFSGTGYVTRFTSQDCAVTLALTAPSAGLYEITIGYHVAAGFGDKDFGLVVNSAPAETGTFTATGSAWGRVSAGKFQLPAGTSKAAVLDGWGYFEVDYIDVAPTTATLPKAPPKVLADRAATATTRRLMSTRSATR